ncbi:MAG TPA: hypothetical protein VGO62_00030, partial [Myxococcota bacterium]
MARIDSFLAQLIAYEAEALQIDSGDNMYLVKGDQRVPMMQVKPGQIGNTHIAALLLEVAAHEVRDLVENGEAADWDYTLGNCLFRVELRIDDGRYRARMFEVPGSTAPVTPS